MRNSLLSIVIAAVASEAQTPPATPPKNVAITGTVRDRTTGQPLRDYVVSTSVNATWLNNTVSMSAATKDVQATTDQNGNYRLSDLPPASYRVQAKSAKSFFGVVSKRVRLSDADVNLDFQMVAPGTLAGKVRDENDEPIPGINLFAVSKDYYLGSIGYHLRASARTNDRGEYKFSQLDPGKPYLLLAERRERQIPAWSEAPLNPKMRKLVPTRTWYPNSPDKDGAAPVTVRPGEDRTDVNITMKKAASFCAQGVVKAPPRTVAFQYEAQQPSSGVHPGGGVFVMGPNGRLGTDRKFRFCDLTRGTYRLAFTQGGNAPGQSVAAYSIVPITIADRDLNEIEVGMSAGSTIQGEVSLDGPVPPEPITTKVSFFASPLLRANYGNENLGGRFEIPSTFTLKDVLIDDYIVRPNLNAPRLYVKDVLYAGRSIINRPFRVGSAIGDAGIRVVIGQDGGTIQLQISDKDGRPVPDMHVLLMPADVTQEADLADRFVYTEADQSGAYTSATLAPGKYLVAATDQYFDASVESIDRLWQSKLRFTEVTLPPGGKVQVKLEPLH
ncbi:MAG: hypothetical protein JWN34_3009 [Bryobacterales bacterium]|nr:hypothetical protein [Bryobacterales bacterium]